MPEDNPLLEKISVSKLDAARRQFETAIYLWIQQADPVSILTLAAAGHAIVEELLKRQGGTTMTFNEKRINPERWKDYLKIVIKARNFFKHADRDPGAILEFTVQEGDWFLLDGVLSYQQLHRVNSPLMLLFFFRYSVESDGLFAMPDEFRLHLPPELGTINALKEMPRNQFAKRFLPGLIKSHGYV